MNGSPKPIAVERTGFGFASRYSDAPVYVKPLLLLYAYALGALLQVYVTLVRYTCRVRITGVDRHLSGPPTIYVLWHFNCYVFLGSFRRLRGHVWLNHPYWYMLASQLVVTWWGVDRFALGSTGNGGRAAANEVVAALRQGYSTMVNPDGPYGPPGVMKKGALHMAVQSGAPIVPLRFTWRRCLVLPSWDRKVFPLPFISSLTVTAGAPVQVTDENFDEAMVKLSDELGPQP